MNFFKTVFSDDPDPESESDSPRNSRNQEKNPDQDPNPTPGDGGWSFGGLMKTLATRSESVIETYRRDLEDFGSGLKKEIEVAQGSLGTVGHAIDEFGSSVLKNTATIIAQGKDAILAPDNESDSSDTSSGQNYTGLSSRRYSRFDAQVRVIQGDVNTYCEVPEDSEEYEKWKLGFVLEEKGEELERFFEENGDMRGIYKRVVPSSVDHETFWSRYFYKVHKLKQAEDLRANLVKRAISLEDEEELSWDIDDDEEEKDEKEVVDSSKEVSSLKVKDNEEKNVENEVDIADLKTDKDSVEKKEMGDKDSEKIAKEEDLVKELPDGGSKKERVTDSDNKVNKESVVESGGENVELRKENAESKSDGNTAVAKAASGESCKSSDISVISSQPSAREEEDLGWDEIEDLSSIDDKEVTRSGGSPNRAELRKRLSAAEEEEDLNWDIEDDDEPVKA